MPLKPGMSCGSKHPLCLKGCLAALLPPIGRVGWGMLGLRFVFEALMVSTYVREVS